MEKGGAMQVTANEGICTIRMAKGLVWATTEDLARNRAKVLSLYRQILRSLNSPELLLTHAARLAKKAEVRSIFLFGAEERSLHNIADLIDAANYSLSILKQGRLPYLM
ncbi:Inositol-tetrakisphosphate 1-kinase [Musa troglodytarum]|uniref:Inositol-tetrakisphosphate 1-kinase n=2 Tax=Musa troglodytarum TaxID=320322 RepID=A0A9E7F4N7_9LILI|nr:Inositol-tetrakisphosphate 1-kinase [Musa troglodytarum]